MIELTTIATLAAAQAAVSTRRMFVHDRPDLDDDARMWASRLCSGQLDAMDTAILLEPPAAASDLRAIALAAISKLQTLEGQLEGIPGKSLLPIVEQLTVALEHIAAHPLLDACANEAVNDDLGICREHAAARTIAPDHPAAGGRRSTRREA